MMKNLMILMMAALAAAPLAGAPLERTLDAKPGELLEINILGGSIEVSGWERNQVSVEITESGRDSDASDIEIKRTAKGISITQSPQRRQARRDLDVEVHVPSRFDLEIDTMGGSITVTGVEGKLGGRTMGGELELTRVGGTLAMSTHGGDVTLRDATVDGSVTTMGGEVLFENVVGDVKGTSMGGNVVYRNVTSRTGASTGKAVHITTMGGEIEVSTAPEGAELSTMGGDIEVGTARRYVKAKTMGGSIDIASIDGWVEARTMGGDVDVVMVGNPAQGDRHVTIDSKGGEIELTLPAGLEADFDVQIAFTKNSKRNYEITSDFPLQTTVSPEWQYGGGDPRRVIQGRGKTGSGKNKIVIRTINGDVKISKK